MQIKRKIIFGIVFSLITNLLFAQKEKLIIGRTTGELVIKRNKSIRVFGFSTTLSGQVSLPGSLIEMEVGDTLFIDFWNISQGNPVSLYAENIDFEAISIEKKVVSSKPIDHMEHGMYQLIARRKGTYLYYSPENYPFNLQAGMFGTIIVRDKQENNSIGNSKEIVWCSHEIDVNWHTDDIMNVTHDDINIPLEIPEYRPNFFLINGILAKKIKGLQPFKPVNKTVTLRLVNAGLYNHIIEIPKVLRPKVIYGNLSNGTPTVTGIKVSLHSKETMELQLSLFDLKNNESILYQYVDPKNDATVYQVSIPVFYKQ
ncbi:multicopper oxidase domain-containing protein [Flavobacterium sp. J27]|uniref:multicopper oxidase domain-containing protein n=1 Tax=Flavobacterium sp. J27 TaxID=2060419 RepID=UPI001030B67F|nr:multicopper oxidase domain-containing protein [Flavobacterium sp. J27]